MRLTWPGFRRGLSEAGFVEGQNVSVEYRWAQGHYERLTALVAGLIERRVAVIVASGGPPPALAAKSAISAIPIVFSSVELGLVAAGQVSNHLHASCQYWPHRCDLSPDQQGRASRQS
jgi:putative ABC transport system substrate-binding protein